MKFEFIAKHRGAWRTRGFVRGARCLAGRLLRVAAPAAKPSSRRENLQLLCAGSNELRAERSTYGSPRVWRDLHAGAIAAAVIGVARLMRAEGLQARRRRRRSADVDSGELQRGAIAPNLLDRHLRRQHRTNAGSPTSRTSGPTRLVVLRGRARPVLAPGRRLVDEQPHDRATRHRRAVDGDLASRRVRGAAASFRPGQPVHQRAVSAVARPNTA